MTRNSYIIKTGLFVNVIINSAIALVTSDKAIPENKFILRDHILVLSKVRKLRMFLDVHIKGILLSFFFLNLNKQDFIFQTLLMYLAMI